MSMATHEAPTPLLPAVPTRIIPALVVIAAVVWASLLVLAFSAGFDVGLSNLDVGLGPIFVAGAMLAALVAAAVVLIRAALFPTLSVVIAAAGLVIAGSLPLDWWVLLLIVAAPTIAARWTDRRPASLLLRAVIGLSVAVAAIVMSFVGASQWGRGLHADPADPPPAPVWLSFTVNPTEGLLTVDGSTRCMVRVGDVFIDPADPAPYLWLSDEAAWTFEIGPCARHRHVVTASAAISLRAARMACVMEPRIDDRGWCAGRLAAGDTVAAIGAAAGVSRQTASAWLKRHGLQANHRPLERPDVDQLTADYERIRSIRKLAIEYGISPAVMRTWLFEAGIDPLGTPGRPAQRIDVDAARRRRAQGDTWAAIAGDLGVTAETVRRRVSGSS